MYRRFLLSRGFAAQENIFKQYLKQAEKIQEEEKLKAEEIKQETAETLGPNISAVDPALKYLKTSRLIDKLVSARSTEKMQLVMEEAFHDVSKNYKIKKDQEPDVLKPNDLAEKLMILWDERPDLKVLNVPANTLFRTIWANPTTEVKEYFGKFQRITKNEEGEYSPFFYGEFGEMFYMSLIKGIGASPMGIRIIRRIVDHMSSYEQIPSTELVNTIVNECITGRWPRALLTTLEYAVKCKTPVPIETWSSAINFYRFCGENYEKAHNCIDLALQSGVTPDYDLVSALTAKHLKHKQLTEAKALIDTMKSEILNRNRTNAILVREEQAIKIAELVKKWISQLIQFSYQKKAHTYFMDYIQDENILKTAESYEIGYKFYEDIEDSRGGLSFYELLKNDKKFVYTPKLVIASLKMANKFNKEGLEMFEEQEKAIFEKPEIYSPFSLNIILAFYGKFELWENVLRVATKIQDSNVTLNKYTKFTLERQIEVCLDPSYKKRLLEVLNSISFPESS